MEAACPLIRWGEKAEMMVLKDLTLIPREGERGVKLVVERLIEGEELWSGGPWRPRKVAIAPFEMGVTWNDVREECHLHEKSWEVYVFIEGGEVIANGRRETVGRGGVVIFEPGEAHLVKPYGVTYVFRFPGINDKRKAEC